MVHRFVTDTATGPRSRSGLPQNPRAWKAWGLGLMILAGSLPAVPAAWQFIVDILPAQLAAEHLSHRRGVDCDRFRVCSYVVEAEGGLLESEDGVSSLEEKRG